MAPSGPPPNGTPPATPETPARRPGWKRILLGAVLVLLCAAGGSAVFVLEQVHTLSQDLSLNASLKIAPNVLANAGWGDPQTLLLVGDDYRAKTRYYHVAVPHLANEMLLVRLDPSKPYISMMSIPRELEATIYPPHRLPYQNRLNSAYSYGITTLVSTLQRDFGLSVNHVVVATFDSFKRAVDEMGCVYSTVDRRYYNLNTGSPQTDYQSINLQPGYQKLCGEQALEFVSFRHNDTSLIRDARDQSFLLDVKKQYGPTLIDSAGKFEHIFGQAVRTDPGLHSPTGIIDLLGTLINMSGRSVRTVHFQVNLQPTGANPCSCDTATPQQIAASVHDFLYGVSPINKQRTAAIARAVQSRKGAARLPLVPTPASELAQARAEALNLPFPLEFPRVEDRAGSVAPSSLRGYLIHGPDGSAYQTYVAVFYGGSLGQYYDVQGMTWTTAPQFDSPDQTVQVGGRTYYLYYEGSNLKMVAWYEHQAVYWVRNTLTDSIGNGELLAIAEQTKPFTAVHAASRVPVILKAVGIPVRRVKAKPLSTRETIGALAGVLTLVAFPLLALLAVLRIRDLRRTRPHLVTGRQVGDRLAASGGLAAVPASVSPWGDDLRRLLLPSSLSGGAGAASGRWSQGTRVYRRSRLRDPAVLTASLVVLVVGAGAGVYLATRPSGLAAPRHARASRRILAPSVPVVVLNATQTPGAAHQLALRLQAHHVSVSAVGNVTETGPTGTEILYAPGEHSQAKLLARIMAAQSPTVAPIDPVTSAASAGAKLVVVIT